MPICRNMATSTISCTKCESKCETVIQLRKHLSMEVSWYSLSDGLCVDAHVTKQNPPLYRTHKEMPFVHSFWMIKVRRGDVRSRNQVINWSLELSNEQIRLAVGGTVSLQDIRNIRSKTEKQLYGCDGDSARLMETLEKLKEQTSNPVLYSKGTSFSFS